MSFNSDHINPQITLENYEEFFILYMHNELEPEQVNMVETFLALHPYLRAELDLLMETKMPADEITFDKRSLFSSHMHASNQEEDLLLFIDNELPEDRKKVVQLEINANKNYQQQFQQLLRARLDPSEQVLHPDKNELYRHEPRVIAFSLWMRIAAVFILIAAMTALYFMTGNEKSSVPSGLASQPAQVQPGNQSGIDPDIRPLPPQQETAVLKDEQKSMEKTSPTEPSHSTPAFAGSRKERKQKEIEVNQMAENLPVETVHQDAAIASLNPSLRTAAIELPKQSFNNKPVTPDHVDPYNRITAAIQPAVYVETAANNDNKKGSFKTLLRKATRLVERTTGIDPANGDEELLIGVVALKL